MGKTMSVGLPSGYLNIRHGKIHPFLIGKPSISMGHLYHGYVGHNQRVSKNGIFRDWIFGESLSTKIATRLRRLRRFSQFDQGIPQRYGGYSIILVNMLLIYC